MYSCICKLTYYGTESAKGHHLSVWSPNCCGPAFGSMGILKGASCNQKRVAHEHRKGLLPFEVAAGDREPSHAAKSRPKTISGAYPNKWRPLPCAYCRFGATLSFTVDYLKNLNLPKLPRDFRNSLRHIYGLNKAASFGVLSLHFFICTLTKLVLGYERWLCTYSLESFCLYLASHKVHKKYFHNFLEQIKKLHSYLEKMKNLSFSRFKNQSNF